ncbi:hypothetical protein HLB44_34900 [Aquincola sp. S2]|uniref:Uncharacterized protein n=1 Tax=Pseudaquabacterium terrae TaxID=2732868 RepID=A0ABX2EU71_9BURK|nr:hypothetical protein [Aquabacterium terrae]NRF72186.1 hypothetical protein [Aquabacterium terrae]
MNISLTGATHVLTLLLNLLTARAVFAPAERLRMDRLVQVRLRSLLGALTEATPKAEKDVAAALALRYLGDDSAQFKSKAYIVAALVCKRGVLAEQLRHIGANSRAPALLRCALRRA